MTQEEKDDSSRFDENITFGQLGWVLYNNDEHNVYCMFICSYIFVLFV